MSGRWSVFSRGEGAVGRPLAVAALLVWAASMAAVVYMSLLPDVEMPGDFPDMDKLYHMAGYAWLAFLPCFAFARKRVGLLASLSMIVLGCALEYAQGYVPGRMASLGDMAANTAGVALGVAAGRLLRYRLLPAFRRVVF
ncbi:VanZ family protein [Desulfolutivibrio sp.]|uniref:VanZ family protein n=1 Tax=Desulfolutivibrio sp. TaxID=2773296 RepID=UPI002F963278